MQSKGQQITSRTISSASKLTGRQFSSQHHKLIKQYLTKRLKDYAAMRSYELAYDALPAIYFDPRPDNWTFVPKPELSLPIREPGADSLLEEDLAFSSILELSSLVQQRRVSATELTSLYIERLQTFNPQLNCVVSMLADQALPSARQADEELASGIYRGPLHGISWGAKDLIATKDSPTSWGVAKYANRVLGFDATVVNRLHGGGAILLAKLSTGALARGDIWFGGQTKNPWAPETGSGGSSAGPASAVAAGLVAFALGTETRGSIISPSRNCGLTGLRPTFGRVSRFGVMPLSWSMDKLGPICRSAADCALVFAQLIGPDRLDRTVVDYPFVWPLEASIQGLRIGVLEAAFSDSPETGTQDTEMFSALQSLGAELVAIDLPKYPTEAMRFILDVEAVSVLEGLVEDGLSLDLEDQAENSWSATYRSAQFVPALEYIRAYRMRYLLIQDMQHLMSSIDLYLAPSTDQHNLTLTNLTGHPAIVMPTGFTARGLPTSVTMVGGLYEEARILQVAQTFQQTTDAHLRRPNLRPSSTSKPE